MPFRVMFGNEEKSSRLPINCNAIVENSFNYLLCLELNL